MTKLISVLMHLRGANSHIGDEFYRKRYGNTRHHEWNAEHDVQIASVRGWSYVLEKPLAQRKRFALNAFVLSPICQDSLLASTWSASTATRG